MIYTEPKILESKTGRWAIYFTYTDPDGNKLKQRFCSGKQFGIEGRGNSPTHSNRYKSTYFGLLRKAISDKLASGWYPGIEYTKTEFTLKEAIELVDERIKKYDFNKHYKKSLATYGKNMLAYFGDTDKNVNKVLTPQSMSKFLLSYAKGNYFNSERTHIAGYVRRMIDLGILQTNPVKAVKKQKVSPPKNIAFTQDQVRALLPLIKTYNQNLYITCMMMYTTLLRPHEEVRLLKRGYFNEDLTMLTIPSGYTKNKKGRNIPIPDKCRSQLLEIGIDKIPEQSYIFKKLYNPYYFSLLWKRFCLANPDVVKPKQTLYSFRHAAAMDMYKRTGSIQKVRIAMDHSNIQVTFTYLRSLDIYENNINIGDLPDIE